MVHAVVELAQTEALLLIITLAVKWHHVWTDSRVVGWIDEVEIIGCWAIIEEDEEEDICDNEDAEARMNLQS